MYLNTHQIARITIVAFLNRLRDIIPTEPVTVKQSAAQ